MADVCVTYLTLAERALLSLWYVPTTGGLKMAEVEFGDSELFEQLDGEAAPQAVHIRFDQAEDSEVESCGLQEQLARCEETIAQLRAENILYRRRIPCRKCPYRNNALPLVMAGHNAPSYRRDVVYRAGRVYYTSLSLHVMYID